MREAKTNPTHNNTIDRVVEKQDPINEERPMRTRAARTAKPERGFGDAARSCLGV
jgi:hypothetical protein